MVTNGTHLASVNELACIVYINKIAKYIHTQIYKIKKNLQQLAMPLWPSVCQV